MSCVSGTLLAVLSVGQTAGASGGSLRGQFCGLQQLLRCPYVGWQVARRAGRQRQEGEDSEAGLPFGTAVGGGQACLEV